MFPVDEIILRVALRQMIGARGVGIAVKIGSIQRNRLVQDLVLFPARRTQGGLQPASYANFRKRPKGGILVFIEFPHGLDEPQHSLLRQVLTVTACQKIRAGTGANQPDIPGG